MSVPKHFESELRDTNSIVVQNLERHADNNIELTLDGVIDFIRNRHPDMPSDYKVFKGMILLFWDFDLQKHSIQYRIFL